MARNLKDMQSEYRKLAAEADKKLRQLERLSNKKGYENVKEFAYRRAMKDIKYWTDSRKRSFKAVELPSNINSMQARLNDVKRFLDAPTSTKANIDKMFKQRADDLNEKFGTDFDWQDLGNVFDNKEENVYYQKYGGKSYLKAVSYLKENEEELMNSIYDIAMGDKVIRTGNRKVDNVISRILDEEGIQFTSLYR